MFTKGATEVDLFLESFAGVEVEVFTGVVQKMETNTEDGDQMVQEIPLVIRGFILNHDKEFIYMGDNVHGIVKCIAKGPGIIVEIVRDKAGSEFDEMLDELPTDTQGN